MIVKILVVCVRSTFLTFFLGKKKIENKYLVEVSWTIPIKSYKIYIGGAPTPKKITGRNNVQL